MEVLSRAREFLYLNARLIERKEFECLFEGASTAGVYSALLAYQNSDGGFGNALEPDKRCPASQPVDVEVALEILDSVGSINGSTVVRACDFLETISTPKGGVPYALPSILDYPHTPWWHVPAHPPASLNPTAAILGILLKHRVTHAWMVQAQEFCWSEIERSESRNFHDLMPAIRFLESVPDRERATRELDRIANRILEPGVVAYDPDATGYVKKPLDWAPDPSSTCRRLFSDSAIAQHLSALAASQQPDGGWPINWDALTPACELEWRGVKTITALTTLRAYGFSMT